MFPEKVPLPQSRRRFLKYAVSVPVLSATMEAALLYNVGVGRNASGYVATRRAIEASGRWKLLNLAGKTVVIKPNLVWNLPSDSGITTDPEVVRAVIDLSLAGGAHSIIIGETSLFGANFTACGYDFFSSYDPQKRIRLVDLAQVLPSLVPIPDPLAWPAIYTQPFIVSPDVVFINIAKMKTHGEVVATLSTKNVFGLPDLDRYPASSQVGGWAPRFGLHDRGTHQTVVDLTRMRPSHFAIIDGIWGLEGFGPVLGSPVRMNTVIAGDNTVAVDRVALVAMGIPQRAVAYLTFAARFGLGPASLADIRVAGDPLLTRAFALPNTIAPVVEIPVVTPVVIQPSLSQSTTVRFWYSEPVSRQISVLRLYDDRPAFDLIRMIQPFSDHDAGFEQVTWEGRSDNGQIPPPGRYAVHVRAAARRRTAIYSANAIGWVQVVA